MFPAATQPTPVLTWGNYTHEMSIKLQLLRQSVNYNYSHTLKQQPV